MMDYDKLESNTDALKQALDDHFEGRYDDQKGIKDLTERLFQLAHGYLPADLLAACEAGKQFVAKYAADTESIIARRALDKMEAAIALARGECA